VHGAGITSCRVHDFHGHDDFNRTLNAHGSSVMIYMLELALLTGSFRCLNEIVTGGLAYEHA